MKFHWLLFPSLVLTAACSNASEGELAQENVAESEEALGYRSASRVYTLSNEASGNAVLVFDRSPNGSLRLEQRVGTRGLGVDAGLGSQGAITLSRDGRWLFAVNPGSNSVSAFRVGSSGIRLVDVAPSGGDRPISVTESEGHVYVLNAGTNQNITGLYFGQDGRFRPLPDSTRALSAPGPVGPAQVQFSPDGNSLIVTEKATNNIDGFVVRRDGTPSNAHVIASSGRTPFGFDFDSRGTLIVSDASGGAPGAGTVSSYRLDASASAAVVSGAVTNDEGAPCWVTVGASGKYAYVTNTASHSVSTYRIAADGSISLVPGAAGRTAVGPGTGPLDMALAGGGRHLYVLDSGTDAISAFRVRDDGGLDPAGVTTGLPPNAVGLAGR